LTGDTNQPETFKTFIKKVGQKNMTGGSASALGKERGNCFFDN
jgi:hypothetical protein